ncbi:MAG TPA: RcnB family protein [Caulobacteraceae bacterium]|jgi:Ni/Co efflux regulator RcnB
MKIQDAAAPLWGAIAGLALALTAPSADAQCQGSNCGREEHEAPARQAPPQNRPAAPPPGAHPGGGSPGGGYGGYRPGGAPPQQGYRPNSAPQPVERANPYYRGGGAPQAYRANPNPAQTYSRGGYAGGGAAPGGYGRYASPGGQAHAPAYSANRRFTYQGRSFAAVRAAPYRYPRGYGYRAYHPNDRFPLALLIAPYFITDFALYNLPPPAPDLEWVRYGPDALLVNEDTGEVVDVAYGVFEEDSGYAYDQGPGDQGPGDDGAPDYPPPPDESGPPGGYPPGYYPPPGYPPPGAYPLPNAPYGYPPPAPPDGYPPQGGPQG